MKTFLPTPNHHEVPNDDLLMAGNSPVDNHHADELDVIQPELSNQREGLSVRLFIAENRAKRAATKFFNEKGAEYTKNQIANNCASMMRFLPYYSEDEREIYRTTYINQLMSMIAKNPNYINHAGVTLGMNKQTDSSKNSNPNDPVNDTNNNGNKRPVKRPKVFKFIETQLDTLEQRAINAARKICSIRTPAYLRTLIDKDDRNYSRRTICSTMDDYNRYQAVYTRTIFEHLQNQHSPEAPSTPTEEAAPGKLRGVAELEKLAKFMERAEQTAPVKLTGIVEIEKLARQAEIAKLVELAHTMERPIPLIFNQTSGMQNFSLHLKPLKLKHSPDHLMKPRETKPMLEPSEFNTFLCSPESTHFPHSPTSEDKTTPPIRPFKMG